METMRQRQLFWLVACAGLLLLAAFPALADGVSVEAYTTARVRSGPGTNYSVIGFLFDGDRADATGRDGTGNSWLRISFDGGEGWVAASVVTVEGDPTTLDIVEPSSGVVTVGNSDVTVETSGGVNIRVGPGTSYAVLGQTDINNEDGVTFDATGRTSLVYPLVCQNGRLLDLSDDDESATENIWVRINFDGFNGWINYNVITVDGNLCSLDIVGVDEEVENVSATATGEVVIVTLNDVNLRASNYPTSEVLTVIPYSTTLTAEARDSDTSRVRVTYNDQTGWIAVSQLEVLLGNLSNLPVEEA
jgi:uncharacterized protein YraI